MSASQLLRLKRNQDEQHQQQSRSTTTVVTSPQISSVTVAAPMAQVASSIQAQQSVVQQPQVRSQVSFSLLLMFLEGGTSSTYVTLSSA